MKRDVKDIRIYKELKAKGINFYNVISNKRKYLGYGFIVLAIIPNGLFLPCIVLSGLCFGFSYSQMKEKVFNKSLYLKYKLRLLK